MPIYEYECRRCGLFEVSQKITEVPLERHDCGEAVERKMSVTSFTLKGGGWYSEGYSNARESQSASSDTSCTPGGCGKPSCGALN